MARPSHASQCRQAGAAIRAAVGRLDPKLGRKLAPEEQPRRRGAPVRFSGLVPGELAPLGRRYGGAVLWPIPAYYVRRASSLGEALALYRADPEPLGDAPGPAGEKADLVRARHEAVDAIAEAMREAGPSHAARCRAASLALHRWAEENGRRTPDGPPFSAREYVAAELVEHIRDVVWFFADPNSFAERYLPTLYPGAWETIAAVSPMNLALDDVLETWGAVAMLSPAVFAALRAQPVERQLDLISRVYGSGTVPPDHRAKGAADGEESRRRQEVNGELHLAAALERWLLAGSSPEETAAAEVVIRAAMSGESMKKKMLPLRGTYRSRRGLVAKVASLIGTTPDALRHARARRRRPARP